MKFIEKIQREMELSEFYTDRNGPVEMLKLFRAFVIEETWESDEVVRAINREIVRAGGIV